MPGFPGRNAGAALSDKDQYRTEDDGEISLHNPLQSHSHNAGHGNSTNSHSYNEGQGHSTNSHSCNEGQGNEQNGNGGTPGLIELDRQGGEASLENGEVN